MSNASHMIALPEDLQAFAEERVRAGEYKNVGAVAQEAFRLLQQRDQQRHQVRQDLAAVFREMEDGSYIEPTDDEFEQVLHPLCGMKRVRLHPRVYDDIDEALAYTREQFGPRQVLLYARLIAEGRRIL